MVNHCKSSSFYYQLCNLLLY